MSLARGLPPAKPSPGPEHGLRQEGLERVTYHHLASAYLPTSSPLPLPAPLPTLLVPLGNRMLTRPFLTLQPQVHCFSCFFCCLRAVPVAHRGELHPALHSFTLLPKLAHLATSSGGLQEDTPPGRLEKSDRGVMGSSFPLLHLPKAPLKRGLQDPGPLILNT